MGCQPSLQVDAQSVEKFARLGRTISEEANAEVVCDVRLLSGASLCLVHCRRGSTLHEIQTQIFCISMIPPKEQRLVCGKRAITDPTTRPLASAPADAEFPLQLLRVEAPMASPLTLLHELFELEELVEVQAQSDLWQGQNDLWQAQNDLWQAQNDLWQVRQRQEEQRQRELQKLRDGQQRGPPSRAERQWPPLPPPQRTQHQGGARPRCRRQLGQPPPRGTARPRGVQRGQASSRGR